jgi:CRP/FNR family transcriptional regulator, cyclic AMP receptor protein
VRQEPERRLDGIRLLSELPPEALREVEKRCRWRECPADKEILDRDSDDRDVYFVVRGAVQIVNYSLSGRKIALARIDAGGYFGELAAIDGQARSATVVAVDDCLLASMPPRAFDQMVLDHPRVAMHLLRRLARVIRSCDDRIMDLSTLGAFQRVYSALLGLSKPDPAGTNAWVIWPLPAQREIASQASTTRETVTRAVGQLAAEGVVSRKGKSLYIRDRARLETLAAGLGSEWGDDRVH